MSTALGLRIGPRAGLCRWMAAVVLVAQLGTAGAQDAVPPPSVDLERRVQELETIVRQLQGGAGETRLDGNGQADRASMGLPNVVPTSDPGSGRAVSLERERIGEDPGSSPSLGLPRGQVAGWNNGFYVQSPDQRFVFRVTGQIQADYHAYLNPYDRTDIDTFLVRRARFGLEATLYNYYEFRFMPDFGLGKTVLEDAYLNIHYWNAFQFEVGKFKQPFSYEQLIQDRYVPTLERSLIDQLVPQRDIAVMVHGQELLDHHLDYAFAISNGEINGDTDLNNNKDFNSRIALHPFGAEYQTPLLRYLEIGMSAGWGQQNQPVQPSTLITPLGVRWFSFNPSVVAHGLRDRYSPDLSYFYGPLGLAAQYFHMDQDLIASPTGVAAHHRIEMTADGFYAMATLLLTGERRTGYSQAIEPVRSFDPRYPISHPGAWELVGRVSRLRLSQDVFNAPPFQLANPATNSPGATEMTLGFNWYFNRLVRMQFNWEHAWFDHGVQLGPAPPNKLHEQDTIGTRFQVIF